MKLKTVLFRDVVRSPDNHSEHVFTSPPYDVNYDPTTQLVSIAKDGRTKLSPLSNVRELEPMPPEAAPAKGTDASKPR